MAEKQIKTKDMIIAVFCTFLTVLCIVFYFLPAFSVEHSPSLNLENSEVLTYSAWDITKVSFMTTKDWGSDLIGLMSVKDVYGVAIIISGILMPLGIICEIITTVFAYLSWFKGEKFKKFCFLFGLCGMMFTTITLVSTWFVAIQIRSGNVYLDYFSANIKGSIAYASFVSLILSFVIAIIACAYNYFLDNFDEDEEDDEEDLESEEKAKKPSNIEKNEKTDEQPSITKDISDSEGKKTKSSNTKKTNINVSAKKTN